MISASGRRRCRGVPVKRLQLASGETVSVATVYDLLMAQYGVPRGLPGEYPAITTTRTRPIRRRGRKNIPEWPATTLIRFAREWGNTARISRAGSAP